MRRLPGLEGLPDDASYEELVQALQPAAWYRMEPDADLVLHDASGAGHDGQCFPRRPRLDSSWSEGRVGGALQLRGPGAGDYAIVPDYPKCQSGQLTVMAWVYAESTPAWASIAKNWGASEVGQFHLGLTGDGKHLSTYIQDAGRR